MKTFERFALVSTLALCVAGFSSARAGTVVISDAYNVTGTGSGFALNTGINSGINPPTTRLTGTVASNLRYINTGTKTNTAYTITTSKLKVTSAVNPGRFVLSADGTTPYDFGPALGVGSATPQNPVVYDLSISMDNDSVGIQRFSFAIATSEGDAFTWDFGVQVYRATSSDTFYTIGKRIDTGSSGLASDLNASVLTMGAGTYGTEITILVRVTDAGSQTNAYNSRVQLSLNGGSTWFYDTATDASLSNGFRFNGPGRVVIWDVAPDAGPVTYDNFSVNWNSGPRAWTGAGANGNWSTSANWGGVSPSTGNPLIFSGTTRQTNTNDLSGLTVPWVAFNNGGFALYGNALTLSSSITNFAGVNSFRGNIAWSSTAAKTWSIASGSEVTVNGTNTIEVTGDHTIVGGGALRSKGTVNIGVATTANPSFVVNEGQHIIDAATFTSRGGYRIGSLATGTGAQTILTNGANLTLNVAGGNLRVGDSANAVTSKLLIDNSTLTLAGGVLAVPYAAGASGNVTQTGGTVSGGTLSFNDGGAGTGTYTVKNGTLQVLEIRENTVGGSASIYFDGATLRPATGANSSFMSGLDLAQIDAGGLTVDAVTDITVAQTLTGTGGLTKTGSGVLQVSGTSANTYSGATVVNAGTLLLAKIAGVNAITGGLTIGDGVGGAGADIVRLGAANQIPDTTVINIGASGLLDLNGMSETVAGISSASTASQVALGAATLTLGDSGSSSFAGAISGTGSLLKQGSGTITLSGANTFTGNTTISAGTLVLGAGGSLASATINLASNTIYNVSAVSGYAVASGKALARNSAAGVGNITGAVTFNSGATVSLMADGTSGTVGTLAISGNITVNANVISVGIVGSPLDVGTYTLMTYTGTKTGSFNVAPTITGAGLGMGLAAKIVESAGVISLKVYVPAHGIPAASIKVVENDLANTTNSVDVSTTVAVNGFAVRDGSSRGDYTVQIGTSATDDLANGAIISSVAENGRDHGEDSGINYCVSTISSTTSGYFIPTSSAPGGAEYNINVTAAYFPYAKWLAGYARNSAGTSGGPNDLLTSSSSIVLGTHFIDNGGGVSTLDLTSLGINSQTDGVLLVCGGANNDRTGSSVANTNGTWSIYVKDTGTNSQGPVAFAFIPKTNVSVISGKFQGDGTILMYNGTSPRFSVVNTTNGTWKLTIPGYSSTKGVLVISPEADAANVDNILSAQPSGSDWIIQSRDLPGLGLQTAPGAIASFIFIPAPTATLVAPANGVTNIATAPTLKVTANNTAGGNLSVTFYGHRARIPGPGEDFLLPVLPDTQNYARQAAGVGDATKEMWFAQTDWIISHRFTDNIPFVCTLGDCVQNGDTLNGSPNLNEWKIATNAYYRLESQANTQLLDGIPYGVTVGNHDQDPNGDPDGTTDLYNQFFGTSHFTGKRYYGGNFSSNNDSWFDLFSAGGLDFIVFSFEYGRYGQTIMDWANSVLATNLNRRVIVLTHHAGDDTPDDTTVAPFSAQGSAIYAALKSNPNFFLMLGGHVFNEGGEGRRTDTFNGHTTRTLISDYQGRFNGGNGLMRLMYFSPSNNLVSVKTYSPYTGNYETDANSQFSFTYNMQPNGAGSAATAYTALRTTNVTSGVQATNLWSGLVASKPYEWYVTVTDEVGDYSTSPVWSFKTTPTFARTIVTDANGNGIDDAWEAEFGITDANADNDGDGQSNYSEYVSRTDPNDRGSALRITNTTWTDDGHVNIQWSAIGGVRYRVQAADDVGGFTDIVRDAADERDPNPPGNTSTQSFTDTSSAANTTRFYRVKVVP